MYKLQQISLDELSQYQEIPMLKEVQEVLTISPNNTYTTKKVKHETIDMAKEESVIEWKNLFNPRKTGLFIIQEGAKWIGGVIVVTHAPKIKMLENNMKNAVLWDIRIDPNHQSKGLGKRLYQKACLYAKTQGCSQLLIETQNNNPVAIRFYLSMGATLYKINEHAYTNYPNEIQYIFSQSLR